MDPLYCTACLDRIPFEQFVNGKAAWSKGLPYHLEHAKRAGVKLDIKPPDEYSAAMGFESVDGAIFTPAANNGDHPTTFLVEAPAKLAIDVVEGEVAANSPRCELVIEYSADADQNGKKPVRINLLKHTSKPRALILGRDSTETTVFAANARISRKHCMVWLTDGKVFVRDLVSSNKTFIDGVELGPETNYELHHTELLTLGAKHSAIRMTLDSVGFPMLEKDAPPQAVMADGSEEKAPDTAAFRPVTHGTSTL